MMGKELRAKQLGLRQLNQALLNQGSVCVAYSGGKDSALLLRELIEACFHISQIHPVYVKSTLNPRDELEEAREIAASLHLPVDVLEVNEFENAEIRGNPYNRCKLCKLEMFKKLKAMADDLGCSWVLDGTNYDDLFQHRPGLLALRELGVISPLGLAKINKHDITGLLDFFGMPISSKPAAPCLATRFAYGMELSDENIARVTDAEAFIKEKFGSVKMRVRVHGGIARIELPRDHFGAFVELAPQITARLRKLGYDFVTLDLDGFRSGSMDLHTPQYCTEVPFKLEAPQYILDKAPALKLIDKVIEEERKARKRAKASEKKYYAPDPCYPNTNY